MTSRDLRWRQVTRKWLHLTKSHLEVPVGRKLAYTVHFTIYKTVARWTRQSRDRKWRYVTSRHWKWPGSDVIWPEVTWKWLYKAKNSRICTFHFLQGCSSQEKSVTWQERHHVTSGDRKWPGSDVIWPKSSGSGCRRPKPHTYCTFHFLQGCSSQEEAVTWQKMTSHDLRWLEVTRKWHHLSGSYQELAVEGLKLLYTVNFIYYKAVAQEEAVTWQEITSRDLRWPEVACKWRHLTGSHLKWL